MGVRGTIFTTSVIVVFFVTVLFIVRVSGAEDGGDAFDAADIAAGSRSPRKETGEDQWKAVEHIPMDTGGWIPDYNVPPSQQAVPKRRRLRKRRRRPQIISLTDDTELALENRYPVRRIKRPQHLREGADLWTQMEADAKTKPNKRRRITPVYPDNIQRKQSPIDAFQADEAAVSSTETVPDLRTILKQAGGSSLSEILQQKNLSLSDLLKGEKEAILAVSEKPDNPAITEYKNPVGEDFPKKTKYSSNYRFTSTHRERDRNASESQAKKVREESTRRVSIKPNNVIVVDFKPSLIGLDIGSKKDDPSEAAITSTTSKVTSDSKPKIKKRLPITSAKLNKIFKSTTRTRFENDVYPTTLPSKAYKISIAELFGLPLHKEDVNKATEEGPLRMSFDLNFLEKKLENSIKSPVETTTMIFETIPEKLKTITAKDEISEVLQDEETRTYLKTILERRNMTFEDLVELRERGSSQRHLADLFHNKTKEPEPEEEPFLGAVKTEMPTGLEIHANRLILRQPKSHFSSSPLESTDSDGDRYVASVEPIQESNESKSMEENREKGKYTVTSFPTYKIELDKKFKEKTQAPLAPDEWKGNYPDVFNDFYKRTHQKGIVEDLNEKYFDELRTIDEVENAVAESGNERLTVEARKEIYDDDPDDYGVFIRLPYGVKHAILASLLIIGISLVIFLTILMIFKWSQKHKKKLCYNASFSCSKIKSPILQGNSDRRSFRTFMSETLGRKKHYYKQQLQSVSDGIWDNDRKSFQ